MNTGKRKYKCINCGKIKNARGQHKFCSHKCQYEYQGHLKKFQFEKNGKTWNKGMKKGDHPSLNRMGFKKNNQWSYKKGEEVPIERRIAISKGLNRGLTKLSEKIRTNSKYLEWRSRIYKKDNYTCQWCGNKNGNGKSIFLNAHHKIPLAFLLKENKIKTLEEAILCEALWKLSNGITLCRDCHEPTFKT